jgi:hypothetical protein
MTSYRIAALAAVSSANATLSLLASMSELAMSELVLSEVAESELADQPIGRPRRERPAGRRWVAARPSFHVPTPEAQ